MSGIHIATLGAFGIVALSWVALFNGAPLVFSDSLMYATAALEGKIPSYFSVFYSWLILPFHLGKNLWPVVFVQSGVLCHLLYLTTRSVLSEDLAKKSIPAVIAALAIVTSLPWLTGQILPDVASPVIVLGLFLTAFCWDTLGRIERAYILVLTTIAITTHLSHVPVAVGLVLGILFIKAFILAERISLADWIRLVGPMILATIAMITVTWIASGQFSLARDSDVFLLAKLIDEGPALAYLSAVCPEAGYQLCNELQNMKGLSHDELKWHQWSPFHKFDPSALQHEAHDIVRGTLATYPREIVVNSMKGAAQQLVKFQTGDGLTPQFAKMVASHVAKYFDSDIEQQLLNSRQGRDLLPLNHFRLLHTITVIGALCICFCSVLFYGLSIMVTRLEPAPEICTGR